MKLGIFDEHRLGLVIGEEMVDVTEALPHYDPGYAANFWLRMCRDFDVLRPRIERASRPGVHTWLLAFDVFLKAPSSIIGPSETVVLPNLPGREIHHESELALVLGKGGRNIPENEALSHVLGYTILIDVTLRGEGDRSRRKSYDGFTPMGPWLVSADEIGDPQDLDIRLWVDGTLRQSVNTRDMLVKIPGIISYVSSVMTLNPGDVITTGAPPGVGEIRPGQIMTVEIEKIGRMEIPIRGTQGKNGTTMPDPIRSAALPSALEKFF